MSASVPPSSTSFVSFSSIAVLWRSSSFWRATVCRFVRSSEARWACWIAMPARCANVEATDWCCSVNACGAFSLSR